jgi:hypothetical protein
MSLRTQIITALAVAVVCGLVAWRLAGGEREPAAPGEPAAAPETADPPRLATDLSGRPFDPMTIGSQAAKDDLYCAGVLFAAHYGPRDAMDGDNPQRDRVLALLEDGVGKLIADGEAEPGATPAITDAHAAEAHADYAAGALRIPLADCEARADSALR